MKSNIVSLFALAVGSLLATPAYAAAEPAEAPAKPATATPEDDAQSTGTEVIVTGTRRTGITQAESATPIKVLDSSILSRVGQPNLNQVLTQLVA
jgi:iron complex outermembrane receptor protein